MNKQYFAPSMETIELKAHQQLMAGSVPIRGDEEPTTPPGGSDAPGMLTPEQLLGIPSF